MSVPAVQRHPYNTRSFGLIDRPRLLDKLQGVSAYKLTLISAPPGYGKTTLAMQFVRQSALPTGWHTIEERERDVPDLQAHSISALSQVVSGIQALSNRQGYAADDLAVYVTDYLRANVADEFIYVIDDVHLLAGSPTAEVWLSTLVAHLPVTCHLVLISRTLPDVPLVEMIARREVLAIGQQELRFTLQEIQYLAFAMLDNAGQTVDYKELAARLEGWPAGTVLALQPLPADLEQILLRGGQGPEALFDALAHSMLDAQPSALRDFLLASSTLTRLTPELCMSVLDLAHSAERLAEAQARNLFLTRNPGGLAYHALFRSFLQRQLKATNPELFVSLHGRAAQWFEDADQIDLAFDHYVAADLANRAATLSERVAHSYFVQGKVEILLGWAAQLALIDASAPVLSFMCAWIHTDRYEYATAEAELDVAEQRFAELGDVQRQADIDLVRAMMNLHRANYTEVVTLAERILLNSSDARHLHARALRLLGYAEFNLGKVGIGITHLEEALALQRADGDLYTLTNVLEDLQFAYERVGRLDDQAACLQELVALRRSLGSSGALAMALNNLGFYHHQRSDYVQALAIFQEGLSISAKAPNKRAESYLLWSLADLHRDRGAFNVALPLYHKSLELLGSGEPLLKSSVLVSMSTLYRWRGQYEEAVQLSHEALVLAEAHKIPLASATARAALWISRAYLGESQAALNNLETLIRTLRSQHMQPILVNLFGLCAEIALLREDSNTAATYLKSALQTGERAGGLQPLAAEITHSQVLGKYVNQNIQHFGTIVQLVKLLDTFKASFSSEARAGSKTVVAVTYSLRIWTLGQERIELDGVRVPSSAWKATTAKEVLLYLVFSGPVSREQLGLVFWPDSSANRLRQSFHTTLYRIRQELGENVITFQDGLYSISPEVQVWCDANEFEALILQARLLSPREARAEDLWRRAIKLYKGDFLLALDRDWVYTHREILREAHLEALVGLGECTRVRRDVKGALGIFKQALLVDPYREDVHRAILICYAEMGEKRQLLTHIRELQSLFLEDLATEPSAETMALANSLLH